MKSQRYPGPERLRAGRLSISTAFACALLLMAAIIAVFFWLGRGAKDGPAPGPGPGGGPQVAMEAGAAGADPAGAGAERTAPRAEPPEGSAQPAAAIPEPAAPEPEASRAALRVSGVVRGSGGEALEGAGVRWLPGEKKALRRLSHDAALLEGSADPARLASSALRDAVAGGRAIAADKEGHYVLLLPRRTALGLLVAGAEGREVQVRELDDLVGAVPPASRPEEAEAGSAEAEGGRGDPVLDVTADFTLGPGGSISGTVTERGTGRPVPGVPVVAARFVPDQPAFLAAVDPDSPGAATGPDGKYKIIGLPPAEHRVLPHVAEGDWAPTPSRQAARVVLEAGAEVAGIDFELDRGGTIRGVVKGPDGKPAAGAHCSVVPANLVAASLRGDMEMIQLLGQKNAETDTEGRFEIRGLPLAQGYRVWATAAGHAPAKSDALELTEEAPEAEVVLALAQGRSISGRVAHADGRAAPGVRVLILPDMQDIFTGDINASGADASATTDSGGAFVFKDLGPGKYRLHTGRLDPLAFLDGGKAKDPVVLDGTRDVTGIELTLEEDEKGRIAGLVVDGAGRPIEGAEILLSGPADFTGAASAAIPRATSGTGGEFEAAVSGSGPFKVAASKKGYTGDTVEGVAPGGAPLRLTLLPQGRILGRVVAAGGAPPGVRGTAQVVPVGDEGRVDVARLMARLTSGGQEWEDVAEDGTFSLAAPPEEVQVLVRIPGFAPARSQKVRVLPGLDHPGLAVRVTAGAALQGTVVGPSREPLAGATVRARPAGSDPVEEMMASLLPAMFGTAEGSATTDAQGRFELRQLAPGEYALAAEHAEHAPSKPVSATLREDELVKLSPIVLSRGGAIRGVVLQVDVPKAGIMAQLMGAGPLKQQVTDAQGKFTFENVPPGEHMLQVVDVAAMQRGKMSLKTLSVSLAAGTDRDVQVVIGKGFRILGKVRDLPAAPMRMVSLRRPGGAAPEDLDPLDPKASIEASKHQAGLGMVKEDGTYEIEDVEPGEYILEVPRMPPDPTDLGAYAKMDRTPHCRKEIKVESRDLEVDLEAK
ncbi:MAG: carboxypeptidase regulatory-like domain-containing protein [Planctomycetes bacterium]|nr:carboxypeptidase regulatory-like domain-containing protein [Planctomycetota bacterium]